MSELIIEAQSILFHDKPGSFLLNDRRRQEKKILRANSSVIISGMTWHAIKNSLEDLMLFLFSFFVFSSLLMSLESSISIKKMCTSDEQGWLLD